MSTKTKVTIPVEVTIHEPEYDDEGQMKSIPMFLMIGGASWTREGDERKYGIGDVMGAYATYLPEDRAASISGADFVAAVLKYLAERPQEEASNV